MELNEMLFSRFIESAELQPIMVSYDGLPSIHYQLPADDPDWEDMQIPRLDYLVDMQKRPVRGSIGTLTVKIWCVKGTGAALDDVEYKVRNLLNASFVQADDCPYCFVWVRSDAFEAEVAKKNAVQAPDMKLIFDIMAFPCQYTMHPDPIQAMNLWTKEILPLATVIGEDKIDGWVRPNLEHPIVYWRLASQSVEKKTIAATWLNATIKGHVFAHNEADRLFNLVKLNTAYANANHIPMEDSSPLFLREFLLKPHLHYLSKAQIYASAYFGILRDNYTNSEDAEELHFPHIRFD